MQGKTSRAASRPMIAVEVGVLRQHLPLVVDVRVARPQAIRRSASTSPGRRSCCACPRGTGSGCAGSARCPGSSLVVRLHVDVLAVVVERLARGHHVADVAQRVDAGHPEQAAEVVVRVVIELPVPMREPEVRRDPLAHRVATALAARRGRDAQDDVVDDVPQGALLLRLEDRRHLLEDRTQPDPHLERVEPGAPGCTVTWEHTADRTCFRIVALSSQSIAIWNDIDPTQCANTCTREPVSSYTLAIAVGQSSRATSSIVNLPCGGLQVRAGPVVEEPDVEAAAPSGTR